MGPQKQSYSGNVLCVNELKISFVAPDNVPKCASEPKVAWPSVCVINTSSRAHPKTLELIALIMLSCLLCGGSIMTQPLIGVTGFVNMYTLDCHDAEPMSQQ